MPAMEEYPGPPATTASQTSDITARDWSGLACQPNSLALVDVCVRDPSVFSNPREKPEQLAEPTVSVDTAPTNDRDRGMKRSEGERSHQNLHRTFVECFISAERVHM